MVPALRVSASGASCWRSVSRCLVPVVGGAVFGLVELAADVAEHGVVAVPVGGQDEDLAGDAVVSGVVQFLGGDVLGLVPEVGLGPWAGQHDGGADAAEFGVDGLVDDPVVGFLALLAFLARAVDDQVVGGRAAGDVDGLDRVVMGQVLACLAAAVGEGQVLVAYQRGEDVFEDGPEVLINGVHLADHHLAAVDHAVGDVQRHDGRDVPGAEHERHGAVRVSLAVVPGHVLAQVLLGHAVLHPDLGDDAVEQQALVGVGGQHPGDQRAVCAAAGPDVGEQVVVGI